jgi:hypothetical protein
MKEAGTFSLALAIGNQKWLGTYKVQKIEGIIFVKNQADLNKTIAVNGEGICDVAEVWVAAAHYTYTFDSWY